MCSYAYLVFADKKAARAAAIKYYDPKEELNFHGETAFVVPAFEKEDG